VEAWQVSNPPILAMSPVRTSLRIFEEIGIGTLRDRSLRLTGYLEGRLDEIIPLRPITVLTPRDPERRGCQLSLLIERGGAHELSRRFRVEYGVVTDVREPDVVRITPVPLYSTYHDCWRATAAIADLVVEEA
jgi:kynureninase